MSKKRSFQGRESFHRMNFLHQAGRLLQCDPSSTNTNIAAFYGNIMTSVAKKCVLRMDCSVKRTLCKGCNLVLVEAGPATVRVRRKKMEVTCELCRTRKRFVLKKNYRTWYEKDESVIETFQCKDERTPPTCEPARPAPASCPSNDLLNVPG